MRIMRFTQLLLISISVFLFCNTLNISAQQIREMQPLDSQDFECLKSLHCIKSNQEIRDKGWSFIFDETVPESSGELTARMKSENVSFYAVYDENGNLIRSTYKRNNVALPAYLLAYIFRDNSNGWKITGAEMSVNNCDPASIKYEVHLESPESSIVNVYDYEFLNEIRLNRDSFTEQ